MVIINSMLINTSSRISEPKSLISSLVMNYSVTFEIKNLPLLPDSEVKITVLVQYL